MEKQAKSLEKKVSNESMEFVGREYYHSKDGFAMVVRKSLQCTPKSFKKRLAQVKYALTWAFGFDVPMYFSTLNTSTFRKVKLS